MHSTIALRRAANSAHYTLATGAKIPKIGYGTWKLNKEEAHAGVADALKAGFRHIDSAWAYKSAFDEYFAEVEAAQQHC